jgi:hypothetical protein
MHNTACHLSFLTYPPLIHSILTNEATAIGTWPWKPQAVGHRSSAYTTSGIVLLPYRSGIQFDDRREPEALRLFPRLARSGKAR